MTASAQEFFEKHDNSKHSTEWENEQFILLKYVFELMEGYASFKAKELEAEVENLREENGELHKRLQDGRDYLMGITLEEITPDDTLEVLGFGRNGLG